MIVHDQDANRCSSFPSTGNSIWKIVGKPYGEATRLDLRALAAAHLPSPDTPPDRTYRHPARTASPRRRTPIRPTPPVGQASPNEPNRWSRVTSSEHGSQCQPRDVEIRIRCVVVDCVVIEGDDCEELARFWSQALGCIITARARTSAALSRRREVPPWMWPSTSRHQGGDGGSRRERVLCAAARLPEVDPTSPLPGRAAMSRSRPIAPGLPRY
jgi:hypothetical protein